MESAFHHSIKRCSAGLAFQYLGYQKMNKNKRQLACEHYDFVTPKHIAHAGQSLAQHMRWQHPEISASNGRKLQEHLKVVVTEVGGIHQTLALLEEKIELFQKAIDVLKGLLNE